MAGTRISDLYPPNIDPTKTPTAYGHRALPRINRELNGNVLLTKQRALMALCDLLYDPEKIVMALENRIAQSLRKLLSDEDDTIRMKAAECLYLMADHMIGREALLRFRIVIPLSKLFDDDEDIIRKNAHKAIEMLSEIPMGAEGIVDAQLVPILTRKLPVEVDDIIELILDTLHFCMKIETQQVLDNFGMEYFTELLKHPKISIRWRAARSIMDLSVPLAGKHKAVEVKCVPILVDYLTDENSDLRAYSAGALMMIAITTRGKYTVIEAGGLDVLVDVLEDEVSEVRTNSLKSLACIAEAPEGRAALLPHVDKIKMKILDPVPMVSVAAKTALKVVTWKP